MIASPVVGIGIGVLIIYCSTYARGKKPKDAQAYGEAFENMAVLFFNPWLNWLRFTPKRPDGYSRKVGGIDGAKCFPQWYLPASYRAKRLSSCWAFIG